MMLPLPAGLQQELLTMTAAGMSAISIESVKSSSFRTLKGKLFLPFPAGYVHFCSLHPFVQLSDIHISMLHGH